MIDDIKEEIIANLALYGQEGCSVNELFKNLRCSKNDFVKTKNMMIKDGIISTKKEGKQRIKLWLNSSYFGKLDSSFYNILKRYENHTDEELKKLKKLKPLFEPANDQNELSGVRVINQETARSLERITRILEEISHYAMVCTLRYHIDPKSRYSLKENQELGSQTIHNIIEKLIKQHKDEEMELRNYLLWGSVSSFSYVF
ncbi:MAG: hypothetical protein ABI342_07430 [Nitrososphaera sp.]|jgi:DNA-binding transcriptional regulator YhcF (GntR family)